MRSTRKQPFCWQEKKINRLIRKMFEKTERVKMLLLYATITEMDSDFNSKDIKYYTKTISTYSGLSKEFIPTGLRKLEQMGILIIVEEKERGKYRGKKLIFTPEKIIEMPRKTATAKPMNGNSFSGKTNTSEDSNYLEDSNYIKNSKDRIDSFHTSSDKEKTNNNNLIIDDELKSLVVFYQEKINRFARPTKEARKNINARLKEYSVDDLRNAIEAFSKDSWRMQNNAQNTMEWFFEDDSQISKWLALEGKLKLKLIKI